MATLTNQSADPEHSPRGGESNELPSTAKELGQHHAQQRSVCSSGCVGRNFFLPGHLPDAQTGGLSGGVKGVSWVCEPGGPR